MSVKKRTSLYPGVEGSRDCGKELFPKVFIYLRKTVEGLVLNRNSEEEVPEVIHKIVIRQNIQVF